MLNPCSIKLEEFSFCSLPSHGPVLWISFFLICGSAMVSTRDHSLHYFKLPLCSMPLTELQKCVVAFSFRRRVDRLMKRLAGQLAIVDYPCLHDELISMATNTTVQPCTLFPISSLRHQTRTKEASSSSIGSYILARSGYLSHWLPQSMSSHNYLLFLFQDNFSISSTCYDIILKYKPAALQFSSWLVASCAEVFICSSIQPVSDTSRLQATTVLVNS